MGERFHYERVDSARKSGNAPTLSELGREGAKRRLERLRESKILREQEVRSIRLLLSEIEPKMLEIGAMLQAFSINETMDDNGDVTEISNQIDPHIVSELEYVYKELERQFLKLRSKLEDSNSSKSKHSK